MTTKSLRRRPDRTLVMLLQMSGDVQPNPGPATKYPCPVCARNVTSRGVSYQCNRCSGWVHANCSGLLNAAQYRRSSDWACGPCSTPPPTPSPTPCCCCLPTPMALASGGSPMFPLVVHQPASPSIWPAVQSLRRGLSTNPGATMWCVCGCS